MSENTDLHGSSEEGKKPGKSSINVPETEGTREARYLVYPQGWFLGLFKRKEKK